MGGWFSNSRCARCSDEIGPSVCVWVAVVDGGDGLCALTGDGVREEELGEFSLAGVECWEREITGEGVDTRFGWNSVWSTEFLRGSPLRISCVCSRASEMSFAAISFTSKVKSNANPAGFPERLWGLTTGCANSELKDGELEAGE